jgi:diaminohydroxyphosphoribosylaminopyrimidine deaminase/5-amino-6-(5-phosphoribosylamino)uracil reductase
MGRLDFVSAQVRGYDDDPPTDSWPEFARAFRGSARLLFPPWEDVFGPLRSGVVDDLVVIGQIGQSLDGHMTAPPGRSNIINGPGGLAHLHRLRSLADAVVIGVGTAIADDPLLTVRLVSGSNPARVVLDPRGRLPSDAKVLVDDGTPRLVLRAGSTQRASLGAIDIQGLPTEGDRIAPRAILGALAARGWRRILIEGGADTLSGFLRAGLLDRLHLIVAPVMFGKAGRGFAPPPIDGVDQALRAPMRAFPLGDDMLLDFDLSGQRLRVGQAKTST